jgi:hypothetical protein
VQGGKQLGADQVVAQTTMLFRGCQLDNIGGMSGCGSGRDGAVEVLDLGRLQQPSYITS